MAYATLPSVPIDFAPDYQVQKRVRQANFGDGYVQRAPAGINYTRRTYSIQSAMMDATDYDTLYDFLEPRLQLTPFLWADPWDGVVRQWLCTALGGPRPTSARFAALQATFVEDFTP